MVSYKRQRNNRELLMRAQVAPPRWHRVVNGIKKCNSCKACSYIIEGKTIESKCYNGKKFKLNFRRALSCDSKDKIYILLYDKENCKEQYIGMTQDLGERM